jgi:hypothetical protein
LLQVALFIIGIGKSATTKLIYDLVVSLNLYLEISNQIGFNLIPIDNLLTYSLIKSSVNGSIMLSFDFIWSIKIISFESNCLTMLCLRCICQDLPLYILFCALPIAYWLSQYIHITSTYFDQLEISSKTCWSHYAFHELCLKL